MTTIKNYLSLIKFSHTIFAMPFALIGFSLGLSKQGVTASSIVDFTNKIKDANFSTSSFQQFLNSPFLQFILVIICMVTARSAAMAFNRYLDRTFDAKNTRTAIREIPKGIISANSALNFVLINCLCFIVATYFINEICFYLSPVALFVILFYSYTKRFTALCHIVLGIGLSLAPIGAYLAVTGAFALVPILFSFAVIFWVAGFDIIFALQDVEFDQSQKLYSIPATLGVKNGLKVSEFLHVCSAGFIIAAGIFGNFSWLYVIGLVIFVFMLLYQHSIVKPNNLSKINVAFMTANGIASVVFAVFVIADLMLL